VQVALAWAMATVHASTATFPPPLPCLVKAFSVGVDCADFGRFVSPLPWLLWWLPIGALSSAVLGGASLAGGGDVDRLCLFRFLFDPFCVILLCHACGRMCAISVSPFFPPLMYFSYFCIAFLSSINVSPLFLCHLSSVSLFRLFIASSFHLCIESLYSVFLLAGLLNVSQEQSSSITAITYMYQLVSTHNNLLLITWFQSDYDTQTEWQGRICDVHFFSRCH
jgi:hypothetical protein